MFKLLVVIVAVLPAIFARTPVRQCAGNLPLPDEVFFGDLDNPCLAAPCNVVRSSGRGVTYVRFTTRNAASSILPRVRATVLGININQDLPDHIARDPCSILTEGACPLSAGQRAAYRLELPVESSTPLVSSDTEITLFGDNNEVIFCYRLQTRVVA